MLWVEFLGTGASIIVAVSLMMKNIRKLRWVNFIGSAFFAIYGFLIQAWPIFGLNVLVCGVNAYYLWIFKQQANEFSLMPTKVEDPYLDQFIRYYLSDMQSFHPEFTAELPQDSRVFFILRDVIPISLFIFHKNDQGEWEILLDYAIPAYRDYANAQYLYNIGLKELGLKPQDKLVTFTRVDAHRNYLKKLGFKKSITLGNLEKFEFQVEG